MQEPTNEQLVELIKEAIKLNTNCCTAIGMAEWKKRAEMLISPLTKPQNDG